MTNIRGYYVLCYVTNMIFNGLEVNTQSTSHG